MGSAASDYILVFFTSPQHQQTIPVLFSCYTSQLFQNIAAHTVPRMKIIFYLNSTSVFSGERRQQLLSCFPRRRLVGMAKKRETETNESIANCEVLRHSARCSRGIERASLSSASAQALLAQYLSLASLPTITIPAVTCSAATVTVRDHRESIS